jgi:hypothetical protein
MAGTIDLREKTAVSAPRSLRSCTSQSEVMMALAIAIEATQDEQRLLP